MPTFGIDAKVTMATDKARVDFTSFYKSFSNPEISIKDPVNIASTAYKDIDITNSKFFVVIADLYGIENEVLSIKLTDNLANELTVEGVGFMFMDCSNLTELRVTNTDTETSVNVQIIY